MKWKYNKYIDTMLSSYYILEGLLFMSKTSLWIDDAIKGMLAFDLWCSIKFTITVYVKNLTLKWVWSCNNKYVIKIDIFWREMKFLDFFLFLGCFPYILFPYLTIDITFHEWWKMLKIRVFIYNLNDNNLLKIKWNGSMKICYFNILP